MIKPYYEDGARFGFTLDHLNNIAKRAVQTSLTKASDFNWRLDAAWFGVVECLYSAQEPPSGLELVAAGRSALERAVRDEQREHGFNKRDVWAGSMAAPNFQRYWWGAQRTPSPEPYVVERMCLKQIWPRLTPRQQEAIIALAAHGDYAAAAGSLGITVGTFNVHISKARRRYAELLFEGETPRGAWGTDRRVSKAGALAEVDGSRRARRAVGRRSGDRPKTELVHGNPNTYTNHGCRCDPCREAATAKARESRRAKGVRERRRVTVSELEQIRARRDAGESVIAIAAEFGYADSYIYRLLTGKRRPIPDKAVA